MLIEATALENKIRSKVRDLDTMPFVFRKLLRVLERPYPSARELGQVIASDQWLSVRVLRMVNSAACGVRTQVLSVSQAVNLLGINVVRSLTFCLASYDSLLSRGEEEKTREWRHGLKVAILTKGLAEHLAIPGADELFVAGMLHDVGKSVLSKHCPREYRLLEYPAGENILDAERRQLGATHAEVGYWAVQAWRLPEGLQACVRHHHEPWLAGPHERAAKLVHLADMLCLREHDPANPELQMAHFEYLEEFALTPARLEPILASAERQLQEMEAYVVGQAG